MLTTPARSRTVAIVPALVLTASLATAGTFHDIGPNNTAYGLSADGSVPGGGVGGSPKMSNDGTRFSGTFFNAVSGLNEMSYHDIGGASGTETSSGWGMSGDGQSAVGLGWISAGGAHAIQWTPGGGTIVGFYRPFPAPATFGEGFIRRESFGLGPLSTYVSALGSDTGGTTISGVARNGASTIGFVLKLTDDQPCPEPPAARHP